MNKRKKIYEGKAKILYETKDKDLLIQHFKDDATAFNNLNVYPKNMRKNLDITNGIFFSQRVLLELTTVGFTREDSYKIVQNNALLAWKENSSFYDKIISDRKITNKIPVNKLKKLFDFSYHTKKINIIFKRSLKK